MRIRRALPVSTEEAAEENRVEVARISGREMLCELKSRVERTEKEGLVRIDEAGDERAA